MNKGIDKESVCGFCGKQNSVRLYGTYDAKANVFYLNRCNGCNAVFLSPKPTQSQLDAAYDDFYYGRAQAKFVRRADAVLDWFRSARAGTVAGYVRPPAKVLDIGCGSGHFLAALIKRGFSCYGTELAGRAAQRAGAVDGLRLKVGPLGEGDFERDFFDGVSMWHVFEHLTEPRKMLNIISRILKPGGYLFISLPNIDSLQSKVFKGKWCHLDPPRHLFFLGSGDMAAVMGGMGFKLVRQRGFSLEQNPFGMQQSLLNCIFKRRDILLDALKGNSIEGYSYGGIIAQELFCLATLPVFVLLAAAEAAMGSGGTMEFVFQKNV